MKEILREVLERVGPGSGILKDLMDNHRQHLAGFLAPEENCQPLATQPLSCQQNTNHSTLSTNQDRCPTPTFLAKTLFFQP